MRAPSSVLAIAGLLGAGSPLTASAAAPADTLIDVGGHRLAFEVREGRLPLAIVLEAGGGADASSWGSMPDSLAARTDATVVVYDRAGLGRSELGPRDLTPAEETRHLRTALDRLGAPEPTLVVGHSYGAMLALDFADRYPERVVGLVLIDPMNPRFVKATGDFVRSTAPDIDDPATDRERTLVRMTRTFDRLLHRVGKAEPELDLPMTVITAGEPWWGPDSIDAAWRASHEATAAARPNRRLVIAAGSDHDVPMKRADLVLAAVLGLMEEAVPR